MDLTLTMNLTTEITNRLQSLEPTTLELIDESAHHAGHAGNTGGGHFKLKITSSHFSGKSQIIRPVSYTHLDVYKRQPHYWVSPLASSLMSSFGRYLLSSNVCAIINANIMPVVPNSLKFTHVSCE